MYDILIIGGGTAGLTAAIYARRAGKTVLLLEGTAFGGQITSSPLVENYPALPGISGADLAQALLEQAKALGAETKFGKVSAVEQTPEGFLVKAGRREQESRALILATGASHRRLGLPNEETLTGRGVSYCAVCDGAFFKGLDTAVVGGGDSALQSALYLSQFCRKVTLIHRRNTFRAQNAYVQAIKSRENIALALRRQVTALHGETALTGVTLTAGGGMTEELAVSGLFIEVGQTPDNAPFAPLADLDEGGYFKAGEDCLTRTPGVFVAGDCRSKTLRQLTTAAADGSVAATAACAWLDQI